MSANKCVANEVPFLRLCELLDRISKSHGVDKKRNYLIRFIMSWKKLHQELHGNDSTTTDSFYPAMRLILPQFDKERGSYGIKETKLGRIYVKILGLNKGSADALRLLNFKNKNTSGDFASIAYSVLKSRLQKQGSLSILEVNNSLDEIATSYAENNQNEVIKQVTRLLTTTSAEEQTWIIRMILKELRLGINDNAVLNAYHPDGKETYNFTTNLEKLCRVLKNPAIRLSELEVEIFVAFRPMLADRINMKKILLMMNNKPFYIEDKMDGERVQIHKSGDDYKYFSRNGNDITDGFGANPNEGSLTQFIARSFKPNVDRVIIDGEMVPYNSLTKCNGSKGQNIDVKTLKPGGVYQPCFYAFDILMFNGKVLSTRPLVERLQYLKQAFNETDGRIQHTSRQDGQNKEDMVKALNEAIDMRMEGIVVKNPASEYVPHARNKGWVKLKPEYMDGLMDELDVLIIGGYFGEGRRSNIVSHFLLGIAVPSKTPGEHPAVFHSLGKVGSGYSMQELHELSLKLTPHWVINKKKKPPPNIILATGHKEQPDLWIQPSKSCIVQVKAAEITKSDRFKVGYTLRFPRVEKIRYDKDWHECMTIPEFEELLDRADGKLATRHFIDDDDDADEPPKKKRQILRSTEPKLTLAPHMQGLDPKSIIHRVTSLFKDKEFCVLSGTATHSKLDVEKVIVENGGSIVKNPGDKTYCIVASKRRTHLENIIKSDSYNVVKAEWVLKCVEENSILDWQPSDLMHAIPITKARLDENFDMFGDGFTHNASVESLKSIFAKIQTKDIVHLGNEVILGMKEKYNFPTKLFHTARIYLDKYAIIGDESSRIGASRLDILQCDLQAHGATITTDIETASHVIIDSKDTERLNELRLMSRNNVVTHLWAIHSINNKKWMSEKNYQP